MSSNLRWSRRINFSDALAHPRNETPMPAVMNDHRPELATQVPEAFRPVKRWRLAFKIWGFSTAVVGALAALLVLVITLVASHSFHSHFQPRVWTLVLGVIAICGAINIPLFIKVLRNYPGRRRMRREYWR